MSVMNCLAELHQEPDLKLTLKFEVEVLCKALNIELKVNYIIYLLFNIQSNFNSYVFYIRI